MNMNSFEEGTECIKNRKVSLTFFQCACWDQRDAKKEMSIRKQSCLYFYIIVSLGEAADHEETCSNVAIQQWLCYVLTRLRPQIYFICSWLTNIHQRQMTGIVLAAAKLGFPA